MQKEKLGGEFEGTSASYTKSGTPKPTFKREKGGGLFLQDCPKKEKGAKVNDGRGFYKDKILVGEAAHPVERCLWGGRR